MCVFTSAVTIGGITMSATAANIIAGTTAAVAVASTALGTYSSYSQGQQQKAMMEYEAKVARDNEKIANENAASERQTGIEEARLQRIRTLQAIGSQQTAMAANGVDVTSGTSLDIIEDTAAMGELDALNIRTNYEKRAQGYEQQGGNFANQANMNIISGKNAYRAGAINAASNGLNGISRMMGVADKWYGFGGGMGRNNTSNSIKKTGLLIDSAYNNYA